MTGSVWNYPDELLLALGAFGLAPGRETPPSVVRDALNDLYRYELRRMRDALLAGRIAKPDYLDHVISGQGCSGICRASTTIREASELDEGTDND